MLPAIFMANRRAVTQCRDESGMSQADAQPPSYSAKTRRGGLRSMSPSCRNSAKTPCSSDLRNKEMGG